MCLQPISKKNPAFQNKPFQTYINTFACGKCIECNASRNSAWTFRLNTEMKNTYNNKLVTLTYSDTFLPKDLNVSKREMQLFLKRLRRNIDYQYKKNLKINPNTPAPEKIKVFGCGEYGGKNYRAHYHLIITNCPDRKMIERSWNKGHVFIKNTYNGNVRYLTKYLEKPELHKQIGRAKEFRFQSQKIGFSYINPRNIEYHNRGFEFSKICTIDGNYIEIPRIFKSKIYDELTLRKLAIYKKEEHDKNKQNQIDIYSRNRKVSKENTETILELTRMSKTQKNNHIPKIEIIYPEYVPILDDF